MLIIILAALTIAINITAFFIKDAIKGLVLFGVSIAAWLILTFLIVLNAIQVYPRTFVPTAAGLFGVSMVIVDTVMIVIPLVKDRRGISYDEEQEGLKKRIYKITKKDQGKKWFE